MRSSAFHRWGVAISRHRRTVLTAWTLVLVLCVALLPFLQKALGPPDYVIGGTESAHVEQLLERRFSDLGSEEDSLVFSSHRYLANGPAFHGVVAAVFMAVRREAGVRNILSPYDQNAVGQISSDEHSAVAGIGLGGSPGERYDRVGRLQEAAQRAAGRNVQVWLIGSLPFARDLSTAVKADVERAEMIGLPIALLILLFALGGFVSATVPLLLAGSGLLLTYGMLFLLSSFYSFDSILVGVATMIGLGIGIDYAMFIVSRFREELARTDPHGLADARASTKGRGDSERVADAVGTAIATSGRTVLLSGIVVALSLMSLLVVGSPFLQEMAFGGALVVVCTVSAALTLLPAALAMLGTRINRGALPARMQPADARPRVTGGWDGEGGWARWSRMVMRHPLLAIGAVGAVLIVAAVPAFGLRYGFSLGLTALNSTPSGKGEQALARSFSPGVMSPIRVVFTATGRHPRSSSPTTGATTLTRELEQDPRVSGLLEHHERSGILLAAVSADPVDSSAATALVRHIRKDLLPPIRAKDRVLAQVGGGTAIAIDLSNHMREKFPVVMALILSLSLLFLTVIFRSILLPIKAIAMNLLVTGACVGLMVLIFQDGHGEHLLGFTSTGFIQAPMPMLVFALLFGLSMDYEIFLIRRMQEEWRNTNDNPRAVATGVEHTARPISAAAAIMVVVFGSFVTASLLELKQMGFALAVAVALDATLIRLVLVPAVMRLLGPRNWWMPASLARLLPSIEFD